jgi:hypothetical protein
LGCVLAVGGSAFPVSSERLSLCPLDYQLEFFYGQDAVAYRRSLNGRSDFASSFRQEWTNWRLFHITYPIRYRMSRRVKPSVPVNIQMLVNANELHANALLQAKINLSMANETRFREEHSSFIHNAEVRRNVRLSREECKKARLDLMIDRRAQLAELFAQERVEWDRRLQGLSQAVYRRPK